MIKNYFKIAWRNITGHTINSLINILGLALGICSCLVIYLIVHFEMGFDKFHPDATRIYRIIAERQDPTGEKRLSGFAPAPTAAAARGEIRGLEEAAGYQLYAASVRIPATGDTGSGDHGGDPGRGKAGQKFDNKIEGRQTPSTIITGPEYFRIFPFDWLAGNANEALKYPFKIVLTESKARKYFGDAGPDKIIGREIVYNDSLRVTVSGIVKDWKENTDFPYTEFISSGTVGASFLRKDSTLTAWGNQDIPWTSRAIVKLEKGVWAGQVDAQLASLLKGRLRSENGDVCTLQLQPLSTVHFKSDIDDGVRHAHLTTLYVLMGIAAFILLLAVINFINLSTVLSIHRAKEIGIRKVLGSSRGALMRQFLMETGILTVFSVILSALLVRPVLSAFHSFLPAKVTFHFFDPATLLFLLLTTLVTTLLAGIYPAKVIAAYLPVLSLKGLQKGGEKWWLRKGLIVFQFAVSLIFIISTIVIGRQIRYMRYGDPGFSSDAVLSIDTNPGDKGRRAKILAERIRQLPGVSAVARQSFDPTHDFHVDFRFHNKGKGVGEMSAALQIGNEGFIPLYRIKLLAGSNLRHQDSLKEFVINESLCRALGFARPEDAVGKFIYDDARALPIIGVVADFHENSYREPIQPMLMADISEPETGIAIRLAATGKGMSDPKPVLAQIERWWKELFPGEPFHYSFLDDTIAMLYEQEQKTATLMNTAMEITIFISCMGLFGLSLFTARQKTKEIGIRKVLGASVSNIVMLLSKDFVVLILLALLIASPVAWYCMSRWLQDFTYRISISAWIFLAAGVAALSIGLLTVSVQAVQAAVANPVKSLRTE